MAHNDGGWPETEALLRDRVLKLPGSSRSIFALACGERLVQYSPPEVADELRRALTVGWSVALMGEGDLGPVRSQLEERADLDNDAVAGVTFAIGAVGGSADDAWLTANRALDAAFGRIEYPADVREFRFLADDMARKPVQDELGWLDQALTMLEASGPSAEVIGHLKP